MQKHLACLIVLFSLASAVPETSQALADGTATATATIGGTVLSFSGGRCVRQGSVLSLSIGMVPSQAAAGSVPDYFGAYIADAPGPFSDGAISVFKNGKSYTLGTATGVATASGATFSGTPMMQSGVHVQGSFKC